MLDYLFINDTRSPRERLHSSIQTLLYLDKKLVCDVLRTLTRKDITVLDTSEKERLKSIQYQVGLPDVYLYTSGENIVILFRGVWYKI